MLKNKCGSVVVYFSFYFEKKKTPNFLFQQSAILTKMQKSKETNSNLTVNVLFLDLFAQTE